MVRQKLTRVWRKVMAGLAATLVAFMMTPIGGASATDSDTGDEPIVEINDGYVIWGIKYSWRKYAWEGQELSEGVEITDPIGEETVGSYRWPISSGTYDPNTKTTTLNLDGKIRYRLYCDPNNMANCALDSTFSDLKVIISPDEQIVSGTYFGIPRENAGGIPEEHKGALAILNIRTTNPETTDNVTVWNDIPSICGEELILYEEGADLDPVSFTYTGPSGKPVVPDSFAEPLSPMYEKTHEWKPDSERFSEFFYFPTADSSQLVTVYNRGPAGQTGQAAFDYNEFTVLNADNLEPVADYRLDYPDFGPDEPRSRFLDGITWDQSTNTAYLLMHGSTNKYADNRPLTIYAVTWDPQTSSFDWKIVDQLDQNAPGPHVLGAKGIFTWDAEQNRLLHAVLIDDVEKLSEADYSKLQMYEYTPAADGWTKTMNPLSVPTGAPEVPDHIRRAAVFGSQHRDIGCSVRAESNFVCLQRSSYRNADNVNTGVPAFTMWQEADGSWKTRYLEGTVAAPNPELEQQNNMPASESYPFVGVTPTADGSLMFGASRMSQSVRYYDDLLGGDPGEDVVPFTRNRSYAYMPATFDATHRYDFLTSASKQEMLVLRDRKVLSTFAVTRPEYYNHQYVSLAPGTLYINARPNEFTYQVERYAISVMTPEITQHPADRAVDLVDGATSEPVTFSMDFASDYGGDVQWQEKPVGAEFFADIEGATAKTLEVQATLAKNGTTYRALVTNEAGTIDSDPAVLTVRSAPLFLGQPTDMVGVAGEDVTFTAPADPDIPVTSQTWQMLVGDQWQDITASETMKIDGDTLTVTAAEDLDSTVFRSVLTNEVGSTTSDQVMLTVTVPTEAPMVSQHPSAVQVNVGEPASFTAAATGLPEPTVQWQERIADGEWTDVEGATAPTFTIDSAVLGQSGVEYRAVFTNEAGQAMTEAAVLTVIDPTPAPEPKPEPEQPAPEPEQPAPDPGQDPEPPSPGEPSAEPTDEPTDPTDDPTDEPSAPAGDPTDQPTAPAGDPTDPQPSVGKDQPAPTTPPYGSDGMPHTGAVSFPLIILSIGLIGLGAGLVVRRMRA